MVLRTQEIPNECVNLLWSAHIYKRFGIPCKVNTEVSYRSSDLYEIRSPIVRNFYTHGFTGRKRPCICLPSKRVETFHRRRRDVPGFVRRGTVTVHPTGLDHSSKMGVWRSGGFVDLCCPGDTYSRLRERVSGPVDPQCLNICPVYKRFGLYTTLSTWV